MKCPLCQVEMRISRSRNVLENDDTPNEETKLYIEQELTCLNKNCQNFEKVVQTVRNELPIG
jgi:hypothetical protein